MSVCRPLFALISLAALAAPLAAATPRDKVDPWIDEQLSLAAPGGKAGVLVELAERADLSGIRGSKAEKGAAVHRALTETAARTQAPLVARLRELGVPYRTFWVANLVRVDADARLVAELAERDDVLRLAGDSPIRVPEVIQPGDDLTVGEAPSTVEWNILQVNADDVWALGFTGTGVVVGGQDTGYQWDHPALKGKYRGWNGASADHNYNWHDAIHSGTSPCGFDLTAPCDDHGHGTHTMGTMVGDDGAANQVGMAPGAKWISCRNMDQGNGTPTTYIECFQWFLAPTDLAGQNPNPALAPDVINNSWGCPTSEGCNTGNFATMNTVVESLRAAGIAVVVSAGNSGSSCSSVNTPAAIFDSVITVGNTTSTDTIVGFEQPRPGHRRRLEPEEARHLGAGQLHPLERADQWLHLVLQRHFDGGPPRRWRGGAARLGRAGAERRRRRDREASRAVDAAAHRRRRAAAATRPRSCPTTPSAGDGSTS